jgi:hypothetical protein
MTARDRTSDIAPVDDRLRLTVELELDEDRSVRGLARDAPGAGPPVDPQPDPEETMCSRASPAFR